MVINCQKSAPKSSQTNPKLCGLLGVVLTLNSMTATWTKVIAEPMSWRFDQWGMNIASTVRRAIPGSIGTIMTNVWEYKKINEKCVGSWQMPGSMENGSAKKHNIYKMWGHQVGTVPGSSRQAWSGRKPTSSVGSLLWERDWLVGDLKIFWQRAC